MLISDVAFLCAPSYRSRAYAQALRANNLLPSQAICIEGIEPNWDGAETIETNFSGFTFKPNEFARKTLINSDVDIIDVSVTDVNSKEVIEEIANINASIIIYSGPTGVLLRAPILNQGKTFLHIHGGVAPEYRGSTAFYFSILHEGTLGATALYLNEKIDTGPIIKHRSYLPELGLEIDRVLDPLVRADLLIDVLHPISKGLIPEGKVQEAAGTTYHVIHPVLKNLALRKVSELLS